MISDGLLRPAKCTNASFLRTLTNFLHGIWWSGKCDGAMRGLPKDLNLQGSIVGTSFCGNRLGGFGLAEHPENARMTEGFVAPVFGSGSSGRRQVNV
jgi:hypothetical protein